MRLTSDLSSITLPMFGAFFAGLAGASVVLWYCVTSESPHLGLLALVGAIFGWIAGLLAAPRSQGEKQHFGELAKVISGFVTGYLLSKLDPLIGALFRIEDDVARAPIMQEPFAEQTLVMMASFGIALLFVFNARLYWSPDTSASTRK